MMNTENLNLWFENTRNVLESAYISHQEPWKQSGMSGPLERWTNLRKPVANCLDKSGTFLDIGCANGFLLECCLKWTAARAIQIEPYGLDISSKLIQLAKARLPLFENHFFVGNAFYWTPPQRFDFVRTELVYVPGEYEKRYLEYILENYVKPDGKLLIAQYNEGAANPEQGIMPGSHPTKRILERLRELGIEVMGYKDGYDPIKDKKSRVAIVINGRSKGILRPKRAA